MKKDRAKIDSCYRLLQNVLVEAFQLPTILFTPPYQDIQKIDLGLRALAWTNFHNEDTKHVFSNRNKEYRILNVKSNLGFYNVLVLFDSEERPDFISIGPFRDEELSPNYFTQILKDSNISPTDLQQLKQIYERMPFARPGTVTRITKHIVCTFFPEFEQVNSELLQYSDQKRAIDINKDLLTDYSQEYAEAHKNLILTFLDSIKHGDSLTAQKNLQLFMQEVNLANTKNIHEYKLFLLTINNYCYLTLLNANLHPLPCIKQSLSLRWKIDDMTSFTKLRQMPNEICHKYGLLVKNYSYPNCSRLTKDVMAHIHMHLDEELSLTQLAAIFDKNASVLSGTFSKETGQSLTKYIQQTRIQEAIRLFNTTHMTVSEVALAVGYQDFSYFSKLFSKIIGCSPKEYMSKL